MDVQNSWLQFAVRVAIGTIAGGMSDTVAVWMLFHPRQRRFGFHGAIPKNQARLAKSLGRTVGERLLTPQDIMGELTRAGFRDLLDVTLSGVIAKILDTERGSLRQLLPASVFAEVERSLSESIPVVSLRLGDYVESSEFDQRVRSFVARTRAELAAHPLAGVLSAERRADLAARATRWAEEFSQSKELDRGVREYIERHASVLLSSGEPLVDTVPAPLHAAVNHAIEAYLPMAVDKLGTFLHHPAARERIREALHELFSKFVNDLRFHERVIARLVVTERTFDKAIDSIEHDGVEQFAALLDDPLVRTEITHSIHEAITAYIRRPLADLIGAAGSDRARGLVDLTAGYLLKIMRSEQTRRLLVDKLDAALERAEERTWADVLKPVDDATIAGWIVDAARSERMAELVEDAGRAAVARAFERPIGRPGRWLPPDTAPRLARAFAPAIWALVEEELPRLLQRLDVQSMVERKVLAFSTERLEELIRGVIQRELRLIIACGYILGALIAIAGFGISRLAGI